jgi:hypothetical protein
MKASSKPSRWLGMKNSRIERKGKPKERISKQGQTLEQDRGSTPPRFYNSVTIKPSSQP